MQPTIEFRVTESSKYTFRETLALYGVLFLLAAVWVSLFL